MLPFWNLPSLSFHPDLCSLSFASFFSCSLFLPLTVSLFSLFWWFQPHPGLQLLYLREFLSRVSLKHRSSSEHPVSVSNCPLESPPGHPTCTLNLTCLKKIPQFFHHLTLPPNFSISVQGATLEIPESSFMHGIKAKAGLRQCQHLRMLPRWFPVGYAPVLAHSLLSSLALHWLSPMLQR